MRYRAAVDPAQRQAADRQIVALLVLLGLALVLHLAGAGSTLLNLTREAMDPNGIFTVMDGALSDAELGERLGRATGFALCGVYSLVGLVWIPINAWGIYGRRPWARVSTMVYFASTIPTCCCTPIGAYGLYALLRADVKQLFAERA